MSEADNPKVPEKPKAKGESVVTKRVSGDELMAAVLKSAPHEDTPYLGDSVGTK